MGDNVIDNCNWSSHVSLFTSADCTPVTHMLSVNFRTFIPESALLVVLVVWLLSLHHKFSDNFSVKTFHVIILQCKKTGNIEIFTTRQGRVNKV